MAFAHAYENHAANIAAQWPGVSHDIKWGYNDFYSVGNKMFLLISRDGASFDPISFKVDADRFLELTEQDGIIPAPYLARHYWITLTTAKALKKPQLITMIERSYQLVLARLPRKQQQALPSSR